MEYGYGLYQHGLPPSATHHTNNTIHALLNRTGTNHPVPGDVALFGEHEINQDPRRFHFNAANNTFILRGLIRYSGDAVGGEMRARFANAFADLMLGGHSAANMERTANRMLNAINREHEHMVRPAVTVARGGPFVGGANPQLFNIQYSPAPNGGERRISELPRGGHGFAHGGATADWAEGPSDAQRMVPLYPYWDQQARPSFWDPQSGGNIPAGTNTDTSIMGMGPLGIRGQFFGFIRGRGTEIQRMMGLPVGDPGLSASAAPTTGNGLGMAWTSGQTGTATIGANGQAYVNTRLFGVRVSPELGVPTDDPRARTSIDFRQFANPSSPGQAIIPIRTVPDPGYVANVTGATQDAQNPNLWHRVPGSDPINITFTRVGNDDLHISAVQARAQGEQGRGNWIEITNNTGQTMSTRGLYLTRRWNNEDEDDVSIPQDRTFDLQWRMPSLILRPGQTVMLRTTASTTPAENLALKWAQTDFGISFGDRLRLGRRTPDGSGNGTIRALGPDGVGMIDVLQRVEVSLMTNAQMQQRGINGQDDNQWRIVSNPAPRRQGPAVG
jgi:hypothetical protein